MNYKGQIVDQDYQKAFKLYSLAAEQGDQKPNITSEFYTEELRELLKIMEKR